MLTGFNHNIDYREQTYHVQTEDSGRENPHIITHLFHGGDILVSERCNYVDLLGALDDVALDAAIRARMEHQHKRVLKNLIRGNYADRLARVNSLPTPAMPAPAHFARKVTHPAISADSLEHALAQILLDNSPPSREESAATSASEGLSESGLDAVITQFLRDKTLPGTPR